jgi:hypothetical protein
VFDSQKLEQYHQVFDLVISEDGSLCPVLMLFDFIADMKVEDISNIEGIDSLRKVLNQV